MTDILEITLKNNMDRIAGAILLGKDLNPPNRLKFPCSICNKSVQKNQNAIQCDKCDKWVHRKCEGMSIEKYNFHSNNETEFYCLYCTMKENYVNIPFTISDNFELDNVNKSDNMKFCENLPSLEEIYETTKWSDYPIPMEEVSLPSNLKSKYHSVYDFQKLKIEKNFNIFHANVNGLETKYGTFPKWCKISNGCDSHY